MIDNVKQAVSLASAAADLIQGGFSMRKVADAKMLLGGAQSFWKGLNHRKQETNEDGLGEEHFVEDWKGERKDVWMFSGCADEQTSADTSIAGAATGARYARFLKETTNLTRRNYRGYVVRVYQDHEKQSSADLYQCRSACGLSMELPHPLIILLGPSKHARGVEAKVRTDSTAICRRGIRFRPDCFSTWFQRPQLT